MPPSQVQEYPPPRFAPRESAQLARASRTACGKVTGSTPVFSKGRRSKRAAFCIFGWPPRWSADDAGPVPPLRDVTDAPPHSSVFISVHLWSGPLHGALARLRLRSSADVTDAPALICVHRCPSAVARIQRARAPLFPVRPVTVGGPSPRAAFICVHQCPSVVTCAQRAREPHFPVR